MRVQQLLDPATSTYSYLVWDADSSEAALIDPVLEKAGRYATLVRELGLTLKYTLETHVHSDHVTASGRLRMALNSIIIMHENSRTKYADVLVKDGDFVPLGRNRINIIYTPGHTNNHICFSIPGALFTGDSLMIGSCGRTDGHTGDPGAQYESINNRLYAFPDDTLVYPGHDYLGNTCSTIGKEKSSNPYVGEHVKRDEFITMMNSTRLAPPERLYDALPSNLHCGML